ncbi:podocalyxin [Festucalex cinctus]
MGATMRITSLLLSLSLLCHKACSDTTAATGVTVAKNAPTQGMTATSKVPTDASMPTIQAVVEPITDKTRTQTIVDAVKVMQAPTSLPLVTTPTLTTAPTVKTTPAPTQPHQTQPNTPVDAGTSSAPPTVRSATLITPIITTDPSKAILSVTTVGGTRAPAPSKNPNVIVTPTTDASTLGTTANHQPATHTHTTVIAKTTQQEVNSAKTTVTSPQQTVNSGTTKLAVREQTTASSPILASTVPTTGVTTSGTPGVKSSKTTTITTTTVSYLKKFSYSLNNGQEKEEEKDLVEVCRRLMGNLKDGNCTLTWRHHKGKLLFDCVEINGKVKTALATQYYEEITKKPTDNKTLIAILASCGALLIMIIILAVCASHHRKPYSENQQHLTEELHTVENGYHDNPTLEVMEVQPEMQEKKLALNGEFNNDGWIVPIDNLLKDIPDEEDTHL